MGIHIYIYIYMNDNESEGSTPLNPHWGGYHVLELLVIREKIDDGKVGSAALAAMCRNPACKR